MQVELSSTFLKGVIEVESSNAIPTLSKRLSCVVISSNRRGANVLPLKMVPLFTPAACGNRFRSEKPICKDGSSDGVGKDVWAELSCLNFVFKNALGTALSTFVFSDEICKETPCAFKGARFESEFLASARVLVTLPRAAAPSD